MAFIELNVLAYGPAHPAEPRLINVSAIRCVFPADDETCSVVDVGADEGIYVSEAYADLMARLSACEHVSRLFTTI